MGIWIGFEKRLKVAGAGGRTRTDMSLTSPDFESGAYTNFATPAAGIEGKDNKASGSRIATAMMKTSRGFTRKYANQTKRILNWCNRPSCLVMSRYLSLSRDAPS